MSTTWRRELQGVLKANEETFEDVLSCTLTEEELDVSFNDGFGGSEGCPFTVWTENFVYFPAVYDGSEWVAWVHRNPDGHKTSHIGGE